MIGTNTGTGGRISWHGLGKGGSLAVIEEPASEGGLHNAAL